MGSLFGLKRASMVGFSTEFCRAYVHETRPPAAIGLGLIFTVLCSLAFEEEPCDYYYCCTRNSHAKTGSMFSTEGAIFLGVTATLCIALLFTMTAEEIYGKSDDFTSKIIRQ